VKKDETDRDTNTFSFQLDDFFGKPTLLSGDDRISYRKFRKELSKILQPKNLLDEIEVQEIVDNIWEARRYQKLGTKLVDAERMSAFEHLMNSRFGGVSEAGEQMAAVFARKVYPDGMTEADFLKKVGLSAELVQARSVLMAAEEFSIFERLVSDRINARKTALKEYTRRKRADEKEKRLAAKVKSQHRDLANDNRPSERDVRSRTKPRS
jgi:hypothetical protein